MVVSQVLMLILVLAQPFQNIKLNVKAATINVPGDHLKIQWAINNATEGDTITVNSGTYQETISIDKTLTIQGAGKETTFIDAMHSGDAVSIEADGVQFSGFTVFNTSDGIFINVQKNTVISDCIIRNCTGEGIEADPSENTVIENCSIYWIGGDGIYLERSNGTFIGACTIYDTSNGIELEKAYEANITGCKVYDSKNLGIQLRLGFGIRINDCEVYDTVQESISMQDTDNTIFSNCEIYNSSGWRAVSVIRSDNVAVINSSVYDNNNNGIGLLASDYSIIADNEAYNNTYRGIYLESSHDSLIENCTVFDNNIGIQFFGSELGLVRECNAYNNSANGISVDSSDVITICNSAAYNNFRGIYCARARRTYIANTRLYNNSFAGLDASESNGVLVNSNLTNNDNGIYSWDSTLKVRYCRIEGNSQKGAASYFYSTVNATNCWWGNETGPFHSSLNPTGTGDAVTNEVDFDPWLSEPTHPDVLLSDLRCRILRNLINQTVYVPTGNIYDDSTFYAFYAVKEHPQQVSAPTQSSSTGWLNPDGSPKFPGDIVTFGGRAANRMVAYYEDTGVAKLGFLANGTHRIFKRLSDDYHVYAAPTAGYNKTEKDYFAFQVYMDGDRTVLSLWGFAAEGTYAGGVCFIDLILPQLATYTDSYYIFSWTDMNADAKPQPNEIQLEAQGN